MSDNDGPPTLAELLRARAAWSAKDREARQKRVELEVSRGDPKADRAALANEAALADEAAALAKRDYDALTGNQAIRADPRPQLSEWIAEARARRAAEDALEWVPYHEAVWAALLILYGAKLVWLDANELDAVKEGPAHPDWQQSSLKYSRREAQIARAERELLVGGVTETDRHGIKCIRAARFREWASRMECEQSALSLAAPVPQQHELAAPELPAPELFAPVTRPGGPERPLGVSDSCWATYSAALGINPTLGTKRGDISATAESLAKRQGRRKAGILRDLQRVLRGIRKK